MEVYRLVLFTNLMLAAVQLLLICVLIYFCRKLFSGMSYKQESGTCTYEHSGLCNKLRDTQFETIKLLIKMLEMKDTYTAGHSERVTEYAVGFGKYLGFTEEEVNKLKYASILHDIGKIAIPENILNKPEKLTAEEYNVVKIHPVKGFEMIKDIDFLKDEAQIILCHHERVDSKGYPNGVVGSHISKLSKIISICDSFDAMTSSRVYRKKMSFGKALQEIEYNSGSQFDRDLSSKFNKYIRENYNSMLEEAV